MTYSRPRKLKHMRPVASVGPGKYGVHYRLGCGHERRVLIGDDVPIIGDMTLCSGCIKRDRVREARRWLDANRKGAASE